MTTAETAIDARPPSSHSRGLLVGALLAYRFALDSAYFLFLEPRFRELGFFLDVDWLKVAESWVLLAALAVLVSYACAKRRASDILVLLLLVIPIVPVLSVFGLRDEPRAATYIMLGCYSAVLAGRLVPFPRVPRLRRGVAIAIAACAAVTAASLGWILLRGGLANFTLDLSAVYEFRARAAETVSGGVWTYLITWSFKVFNLVLIAFALHRRRWGWLAAALVVQVALFGLTLHKSVLFYPLLVIGLYLLDRLRLPDHAAVWALAALVLGGVVLFVAESESIFPSLLIRRTLFTPALLDYAYYDFFGREGHVWMSNGVLGRFFTYPFDLAPPNLIGRYLYGLPRTSANTGFIATGFMHFGAWGAIAFGLVTGWLLSVSDALAKARLPRWLGLSAVVAPFFSVFTSSDLPTSILTHGIAAGLVVLWLMSSAEEPAFVSAPARAPLDPARLGRILDRLGLAVALLAIIAIAGRLTFGVDTLSESTVAAMARDFANGGRPFLDELGRGQTAAMLLAPLVRAWQAVAGTAGLVLMLRGATFALALAAFAACAAALSRSLPARTALPAAACSVTLVGAATATGEHRIGALLLTLCISLAVLALDHRTTSRSGALFAAAGGLSAGLAFTAHPQLRVAVICSAIFLLWWTDRTTRPRSWVFAAALAAGAAPMVVAQVLAGPVALADCAAYAAAMRSNLEHPAFVEFVIDSGEFLAGRWPLLATAALAWFAHSRGRRVSPLLFATALAAFLPWGDGPARTLQYVPLAVMLLGAAAWFFADRTDRSRRLIAMWGLGLPAIAALGALVSAGTGSLPAAASMTVASVPFAVALLSSSPATAADRPSRREAATLALVSVACFAGVFHQYAYVPGDARISAHVATIADGPYRGLSTTGERAGVLAAMNDDLGSFAGPDERLAAFDRMPSAYLTAAARPAGPAADYSGVAALRAGLPAPATWYDARGAHPTVAIVQLDDALGVRPARYGWDHPLAEYVRSRTESVVAETETYRIVTLRAGE